MFYAQHPIAFHGIGNYSFPMLSHLAHHPKVELFYFQPIYSKLNSAEYAARLYRFIIENNLDIFHFPSPMSVPFPNIILSDRMPSVSFTAMVHDLIPSVYPDIYLHAEHFKNHYNLQMEMLHRMDHLITNTDHTKKDLLRFGFDASRISVIGFGCDESYFPYKGGNLDDLRDVFPVDQPYVLSFTPGDFRKNPDRTIQAFASAVNETNLPYYLVFVGGVGENHRKLLDNLSAKHGVAGRVHFTNRLSKPQMLRLINRAHVIALPSLYEGIGLPVVEGMQCGVPILTSNISSLPEVAGDAAITVDPEDVSSISAGLKTLLTDEPLREQLKQKGLERVKSFDWNSVAERTVTAFEKMLNEKGRILLSNPDDASIQQLRQEMDQLRQEWAAFKQGIQQDIATVRQEWGGFRNGFSRPRKGRKAAVRKGRKAKLKKSKKHPRASKKSVRLRALKGNRRGRKARKAG